MNDISITFIKDEKEIGLALDYEDDNYSFCRKKLPCLGTNIETKDGLGKVVAVDLLKMSYKVDIPDKGIIECFVENESN